MDIEMKRMIMLMIVMVTMLVSLGGCYVVPLHDGGRGGYGHHRNGGYDQDRGRGEYYRDWNGRYYQNRWRGEHNRHWKNGYDYDRH